MSAPGGGRPPSFPPAPGPVPMVAQPTFGTSPNSPQFLPSFQRTQSAPAYPAPQQMWSAQMHPMMYHPHSPMYFNAQPGGPFAQVPQPHMASMKPAVSIAPPTTPRKALVITDKTGQPLDLGTQSSPAPAPAPAPATPVAADKGAAAPAAATPAKVVKIATPDGKPVSREELVSAAKAPTSAPAEASSTTSAGAQAAAPIAATKPAETAPATAEQPVVKAQEPAKKAEEPAKKAEEPAKTVEEPVKKVDEPAPKAAEPVKATEAAAPKAAEPAAKVDEQPKKVTEEPAAAKEDEPEAEPTDQADEDEDKVTATTPQLGSRADSLDAFGTEGDDAGDDESDGMRTPASMSRTASSQGVVVRDGVKRISRDEMLRYRGVTDKPKNFDAFPEELRMGDVRHSMSFVAPPSVPVSRTRSKGAGAGGERPGRKGGKGDGGDRMDRGDRGERGGRRGDRGGGRAQPLPTNVAPLTVSENAYRKFKATEENQVEATLRRIRAILNKLTLDNFHPLSKELLEIDITDPAELASMVDIFFEKAVDEPRFGPVYANMCQVIRSDAREVILLSDKGEPEKKTLGDTFRRALLRKCQAAFEQKEFRAAELTPEEQAALTPEQIEEMDFNRHRAKRQMLGIMTFIGELYKTRMLREQIMHDCIRRLSGPEADEQDLECLCNLLRTVGQQLDSAEGGKRLVDEHFKRLQEWAAKGSLPARVRFMIEGVLDLRRKDRWISKKDSKLKTIEQIHQEAEEQQRAASRTSSRQSTDRRSMGGSRAPPPMQDRVQLDRLGIKAQATSQSATTLAPSWQKRTASSGGSQAPTMAAQAVPKVVNKFDALAIEELSSSPPSATPPSRAKHEPSPAATSKPTGNPDHVRTKSAALVDEYLGIRDMEEAERCVRELEDQNLNSLIVSTLITSTLEKKAADIDVAIKLLASLLASGVLSAADFIAGYDEAFAEIDELTTDIPACPSIAGDYIAQAVVLGKVPASSLKELSTVRQAETFGKVRDTAAAKVLAAAGGNAALSAEVKEALTGPAAPANLAEATLALQGRLEAAVADADSFSEKLSAFDAAESRTLRFARQLMFILLSHVHPEGKPTDALRQSELEAYAQALKQYADHSVEVVTGLLEGVDRFVIERSPSEAFVHALMMLLYEQDVAPEDAINDWRKNAAPSPQMLGKVNAFLKWLDTASSENE